MNSVASNQQAKEKGLATNQEGSFTQNEQGSIEGIPSKQQDDSVNDSSIKQQEEAKFLETDQQDNYLKCIPSNQVGNFSLHQQENLNESIQSGELNYMPKSKQGLEKTQQGLEANQQSSTHNAEQNHYDNISCLTNYQKGDLQENAQNEPNHMITNELKDLALEISNQSQKNYDELTVLQILQFLIDQKPEYSNFKYIAHGEFALVLEATKNKSEIVALKISKYIPKPEKEMKKQQDILKFCSESEYFVQIRDMLYLYKHNLVRYEAIEMELCQSSLREYLQYLKEQKITLSKVQKEILAIQVVDSINLLHQRGIVHKDIRPESILVQHKKEEEGISVYLKLSNLRLASSALERNSKQNLSERRGTLQYMSEEAKNGKFRKESDLFSLGVVLLELDNYEIFDYSKVDIVECIRKEGVIAFKSYNLNQTSLLFEAAKVLLTPKCNKRINSKKILARLIFKKECQNIPLYSVITSNNTSSFMLNCRIIQKLENLNPQPQLSIEQIRKAVDYLYKKQEFSLFSILGSGSSGLIFSVINLKNKREAALKISLASNKQSILRQIEVMKKCRSPYIVQFHSHQFFKDEENIEYVALEFEKCDCTLTQFLDHETQQEQYPPDIKERIALQIIDSISLIHDQNILHGDIKLSNFLISEDVEGRINVKLTGIQQSGILNTNLKFDEFLSKGKLIKNSNCLFLERGSQEYFSPERYHTQKNPTTKLSDGFSAGICLLLLDNYLSFSKAFCSSHTQLLSPYEKPYHNFIHLFNIESQIYKWALYLLAFDPKKRLFPSEIVVFMINSPTPLFSKQNTKLPLHKEYLDAPCLFLRNLKYQKVEELITSHPARSKLEFLSIFDLTNIKENSCFNFISALNELSQFQLNLQYNSLTSVGVGNLLKSISQLSYLFSLEIYLSSNQIGSEGETNLSQDLSALLSLSSFKLYLNSNKLTSLGVNNVLKSISMLTSLSSLEVNLDNNKLGIEGDENICQDLSALASLSSFKLDLSSNKLTSIGVNNVLKSISILSSLSSLEINLDSNQLGIEGDVNICQDLSPLSSLSLFKLYLNSNKLASAGVGNILKSISKLSSLSSLEIYLSHNQIRNEGDTTIWLHLSELVSLSLLNLYLNNNKLESTGVGNLLKGISKLSFLSSLEINLSYNQIESQGETSIYQDLSQLTSLSSFKLNLQNNKLTSTGACNLLKSISKISSLSSLEIYLSNNQIGIEADVNIWSYLSEFTSLTQLKLNLNDNKLKSVGIDNLLKGISKLSSLTTLQIQLSYNKIGIEGEVFSCSQLSELSSLSSLKLSLLYNKLTSAGAGNLLRSISKLSSLSSLEIELIYNQLGNDGESNICSDILALTSLSSLKLNLIGNKMTNFEVGNLLKDISKLSSLSSFEIQLQNNQLKNTQKILNYFNQEFKLLVYKSCCL